MSYFKIYQLASGILHARIVRYVFDRVVLELKFEMQESFFETLTKDSFTSLDEWVGDTYSIRNY